MQGERGSRCQKARQREGLRSLPACWRSSEDLIGNSLATIFPWSSPLLRSLLWSPSFPLTHPALSPLFPPWLSHLSGTTAVSTKASPLSWLCALLLAMVWHLWQYTFGWVSSLSAVVSMLNVFSNSLFSLHKCAVSLSLITLHTLCSISPTSWGEARGYWHHFHSPWSWQFTWL